MKILVVDDHAAFRRFLADFLRSQAGIEVVGEAADGAEAIEQVGLLHPDLVLMDLSMPKMNGYDATKAIKERDPRVRVVVISGNSGEVYRRAAADCHADGFIEKNTMKAGLQQLLDHGSRYSMAV